MFRAPPMTTRMTERLVLKRRQIWHVPHLVDTYRDVRTLTYLGGSCSLFVAYRRLLRGCFGASRWTIFLAGSGEPIGSVGFWRWPDGRPELAYWLDPDHWGAGLATEAISAALAMNSERPVVAMSRTANLGSCLVLEKLGFVPEANLRRFGADQQLYVLN